MKIVLKAMSPISHGEYKEGVDIGNMMMFRKMPMINKSGEVFEVPVLSGNSLRGNIRRLLARELIEKYELQQLMKTHVFNKFYTAIANGGNLSKELDVAVDTEGLREIRKMFPMLSVFGSALYKYMLAGMFNMGFAALRCKELETGEKRVSDLITDIGLTRHADREWSSLEDSKPMPYLTECIIAGAEFDAPISFAPQATSLEISCVYHGFKQLKFVGGKNASGFGEVEVLTELNDSEYVEWLEKVDEDHINEIVKFAGNL